MNKRKIIVGVIGGSTCTEDIEKSAIEVGRHIAEKGGILVCGGLGGVMKASAKGAKEAGGITIGILPSANSDDANQYIDIAIPTGIGYARNVIIINIADVVIAIDGKYGTLSEIAFCLQFGVPVISLLSWKIDESIISADNPKQAVDIAFSLMRKK